METRIWEKDASLLAVEELCRMPCRWAIGLDGSKFFHEIKKREVLVGIKCPKCEKVYVPPRLMCGPCFVKMDELVELGREGVVRAVTLVNYPFIDPDTGSKRPIPYFYGYIQLDGADNLFSHIIQTPSGAPVRVGDRVTAVFATEKRGRIEDIRYFEPVD
jgi:uncharacterized OB-fold protein